MMGGFGGSMGGVAGASKAKRPINVKFEIPYFTTSGIQVRYLKIIEPKVRTLPCLTLLTFDSRPPLSVENVAAWRWSHGGVVGVSELLVLTFWVL